MDNIKTTAPAAHAVGRDRLMGHLAMVLFALLIAGSFSIGAQAVQHIGSVPLNAVRFLLAVVLMGAWTFGVARRPFALPKASWRFLMLGGLMAVYFITMFVALTMTAPVATSAVFTLMPLMAAFFGLLILGQTVGPVTLVSLAFAGTGSAWVIFRGELEALLAFDIGRGEMIYFLGCVAHAAYAPLVRRLNRGEPTLVFTFWTLVGTALIMTAFGIGDIVATDWAKMPPIVWIALGYLAVFTTAVTFFLLQFASLRLPASKVLAYGYLTPVFVILIEGLAGHGWASATIFAGALATCLGLLVLYLTPDR